MTYLNIMTKSTYSLTICQVIHYYYFMLRQNYSAGRLRLYSQLLGLCNEQVSYTFVANPSLGQQCFTASQEFAKKRKMRNRINLSGEFC